MNDWTPWHGSRYDTKNYRITENHEPLEAEMTGKTLTELNVKPGDVVGLFVDGEISGVKYTLAGQDAEGDWLSTCRESQETLINAPVWFIVPPTRADLIAQRDALQAQIDAMPETVRVWAGVYVGKWHVASSDRLENDTHYRDFALIDGVPEGFVKVEDRT